MRASRFLPARVPASLLSRATSAAQQGLSGQPFPEPCHVAPWQRAQPACVSTCLSPDPSESLSPLHLRIPSSSFPAHVHDPFCLFLALLNTTVASQAQREPCRQVRAPANLPSPTAAASAGNRVGGPAFGTGVPPPSRPAAGLYVHRDRLRVEGPTSVVPERGDWPIQRTLSCGGMGSSQLRKLVPWGPTWQCCFHFLGGGGAGGL